MIEAVDFVQKPPELPLSSRFARITSEIQLFQAAR
jgi:hypothetical protein